MKRSDLYREYARVIDMCGDTSVDLELCVRLNGFSVREPNFKCSGQYTFALAIVEDKPVFATDVLYASWGNIVEKRIFKSGNEYSWSWNEPKPTKFKLNGVELSLPSNDNIGRGYCLRIYDRNFWFKNSDQRDAVKSALYLLLDGKLNDE